MKEQRVERLLQKLRSHLVKPEIPDEVTGRITFNMLKGGMAGSIKVEMNIEETSQ